MAKKSSASIDSVDWRAFGPGPVIGVDEVGRGCLAGPVYAAAAVLPLDFAVEGVTDSKLLSEKRREKLAVEIQANARVCVGVADEDEIASINILQASFLAMRRAIEGLGLESGHVLVDGHQTIPGLARGFRQTAIVKGDLRATPIGAAAIVAKVARDRLMAELGERYPEYGFASNKGYAAASHLAAIVDHGPCLRHRREFAGVREHWSRVRPEAASSDLRSAAVQDAVERSAEGAVAGRGAGERERGAEL